MPEFTFSIGLVLFLIGLVIFLFIVEWVRVDVAAILMMVSLPLLGLVTPSEAFMGLGSNAVVSIIAIIIIGEALDKTGLVNRIVAPILRVAGNSTSRVVILISATVACISGFMQNIGAAALFLPALQRISTRLEVPLSRILMPVGFCAILGGTVTLVGSSPLILLNDLIKPFGLEPFSLFSVTPIGLALVASGIAYFVFFGKWLLPRDLPEQEDIASTIEKQLPHAYCHIGKLFELRMPDRDAERVSTAFISDTYQVNVVGVSKPETGEAAARPEGQVIGPSDELVAFGLPEDVHRLAADFNMHVKERLERFQDDVCPPIPGTAEAVIPPHSGLVGKTFREARLWREYDVKPLAVYRGKKVFYLGVSNLKLRAGDAVILQGVWERFHALQKHEGLAFVTPVRVDVHDGKKALLAGFWLVTALFMIIVLGMQLSVSLMTAALGMIMTKVLSIDEAYQSVDWRTVFLLAGLMPLSIATEKSGAAVFLARGALHLMGDMSPPVFMAFVGALSTALTLAISNVGATVLLVPLVVNLAEYSNVDPRMAALAVGLATSNSFLLPTHQVNALYMGAGRYHSKDFLRAGSIMTVIFIAVMTVMIVWVY